MFYTFLFISILGKALKPTKAAANILKSLKSKIWVLTSLFWSLRKGDINLDKIDLMDLKTQL